MMEDRLTTLRDRWVSGKHIDAEKIMFFGTKTASIYNLIDTNIEHPDGETNYAIVEHKTNWIQKLFKGETRTINSIKRYNIYPEIVYINGHPVIVVFQNEGSERDTPLPIMLDISESRMKEMELTISELNKRIKYYQQVLEVLAGQGIDIGEAVKKMTRMEPPSQPVSFHAEMGEKSEKKRTKR